MRLVFHPRVHADLVEIMAYYERVGAPGLVEAFYAEFLEYANQAAAAPASFASRIRNIRRADLRRFPYHILFRVSIDSVRVLVVRHHRRRPSLGLARR